MKAVVYNEYAKDNDFKKILKLKDVDEPKPKASEVIVKINTAALN